MRTALILGPGPQAIHSLHYLLLLHCPYVVQLFVPEDTVWFCVNVISDSVPLSTRNKARGNTLLRDHTIMTGEVMSQLRNDSVVLQNFIDE